MKKEMNNKGFSLVELIIVIAIMAVLIGVLAPQYLKYVKESKISTDITNAESMATAINVGIADPKCGAAHINGTSFNGASGTASVYDSTAIAAGLSDVKAPDSKLTPGNATWVVDYDDSGVKSIELNGIAIWPNASEYENQ